MTQALPLTSITGFIDYRCNADGSADVFVDAIQYGGDNIQVGDYFDGTRWIRTISVPYATECPQNGGQATPPPSPAVQQQNFIQLRVVVDGNSVINPLDFAQFVDSTGNKQSTDFIGGIPTIYQYTGTTINIQTQFVDKIEFDGWSVGDLYSKEYGYINGQTSSLLTFIVGNEVVVYATFKTTQPIPSLAIQPTPTPTITPTATPPNTPSITPSNTQQIIEITQTTSKILQSTATPQPSNSSSPRIESTPTPVIEPSRPPITIQATPQPIGNLIVDKKSLFFEYDKGTLITPVAQGFTVTNKYTNSEALINVNYQFASPKFFSLSPGETKLVMIDISDKNYLESLGFGDTLVDITLSITRIQL